MPELGHMAYYVRNLERSVAFYQKVVGLKVVGRIFNGRAAVLSGGSKHHELLLIQVSSADGPLTGRRVGLYHVGWKVGDCFSDLQQALDRAQTYGTEIQGTADHGVMYSLYLRDPDQNEVELYVDNAQCNWREDNSWMEAPVRPLDLSVPYNQRSLGTNAKLGLRQPLPQPLPRSPQEASERLQPSTRLSPLPQPPVVKPNAVGNSPPPRQVAEIQPQLQTQVPLRQESIVSTAPPPAPLQTVVANPIVNPNPTPALNEPALPPMAMGYVENNVQNQVAEPVQTWIAPQQEMYQPMQFAAA